MSTKNHVASHKHVASDIIGTITALNSGVPVNWSSVPYIYCYGEIVTVADPVISWDYADTLNYLRRTKTHTTLPSFPEPASKFQLKNIDGDYVDSIQIMVTEPVETPFWSISQALMVRKDIMATGHFTSFEGWIRLYGGGVGSLPNGYDNNPCIMLDAGNEAILFSEYRDKLEIRLGIGTDYVSNPINGNPFGGLRANPIEATGIYRTVTAAPDEDTPPVINFMVEERDNDYAVTGMTYLGFIGFDASDGTGELYINNEDGDIILTALASGKKVYVANDLNVFGAFSIRADDTWAVLAGDKVSSTPTVYPASACGLGTSTYPFEWLDLKSLFLYPTSGSPAIATCELDGSSNPFFKFAANLVINKSAPVLNLYNGATWQGDLGHDNTDLYLTARVGDLVLTSATGDIISTNNFFINGLSINTNYGIQNSGDFSANDIYTGLTKRLDSAGALTNVTANTSILTAGTMATARLGSGTANSTVFLRGDSTWTGTLTGNFTINKSSPIMYLYNGTSHLGNVGHDNTDMTVLANTGNLRLNSTSGHVELVVDMYPAVNPTYNGGTGNWEGGLQLGYYNSGADLRFYHSVYAAYYFGKYTSIVSFDEYADRDLIRNSAVKQVGAKKLVDFTVFKNLLTPDGQENTDNLDMGKLNGYLFGVSKAIVKHQDMQDQNIEAAVSIIDEHEERLLRVEDEYETRIKRIEDELELNNKTESLTTKIKRLLRIE